MSLYSPSERTAWILAGGREYGDTNPATSHPPQPKREIRNPRGSLKGMELHLLYIHLAKPPEARLRDTHDILVRAGALADRFPCPKLRTACWRWLLGAGLVEYADGEAKWSSEAQWLCGGRSSVG